MKPNSSADALLEAHEEKAAASNGNERDSALTATTIAAVPLQARDLQWLDDVYQACLETLEGCDLCDEFGQHMKQSSAEADKKVGFVRQQCFGVFMSSALSFAWNKEISLKSKTYKTWSTARAALVEVVKDAASKALKSETPSSDVVASASHNGPSEGDWQAALLTACDQTAAAVEPEQEKPLTGLTGARAAKKMKANDFGPLGISWCEAGESHSDL